MTRVERKKLITQQLNCVQRDDYYANNEGGIEKHGRLSDFSLQKFNHLDVVTIIELDKITGLHVAIQTY